jgi:hypothetical protein
MLRIEDNSWLFQRTENVWEVDQRRRTTKQKIRAGVLSGPQGDEQSKLKQVEIKHGLALGAKFTKSPHEAGKTYFFSAKNSL